MTRENNRIAVLFAGQSTIPSLSLLLVQSPKQSAKNICHHWFDVASVYMYVKYVSIYLYIRTLYTCAYACMCVCVQGNVMLCNALRIGRNNMCQLEKTSLFEGLGFTFLATKKIKLEEQNVCKII